jgi:glycosyltransferase involved in cell wall biosynthesis
MPSFNHASYIMHSVRSVLDQTVRDLELLIVDDGSSDGTRDILRSVTDRRVSIRFFDRNRGACAAMNEALGMASGDIIAVCNSDDIWERDKLARQLPLLDRAGTVGVVFSDVRWVDEVGCELTGSNAPPFADVFKQRNTSRAGWIRRLVLNGNCLCHPSAVLRREVYQGVGLYDNRLRQLPDFDMWLRVAQMYDLFVCSDQLVRFRLLKDHRNTSSVNPTTSNRDMNERYLILKQRLLPMSGDLWCAAFGTTQEVIDDIDLEIEKMLFFLQRDTIYTSIFRQLAIELAFDLLGRPLARERLVNKYRFDVLTFQSKMGESHIWFDMINEIAANGVISINRRAILESARTRELRKALRHRRKVWSRRLMKGLKRFVLARK